MCILVDYYNSVRTVCQVNVIVVNETSIAESLPFSFFILWRRHLVVPLLVAIHIINIETSRTEASINQVVINSNYILAIIRLNLDVGVECLGVIEVLCLLVDDFNLSRGDLSLYLCFSHSDRDQQSYRYQ